MSKFHNEAVNNQHRQRCEYMTECEVAYRLQMSKKWLQKMRYAGGGIPYHKFGGTIRYAVADIQAFEQAARMANSSEQPKTPLYTHYRSKYEELESLKWGARTREGINKANRGDVQ